MYTLPLEGAAKRFTSWSSRSDLKILQWFPTALEIKSKLWIVASGLSRSGSNLPPILLPSPLRGPGVPHRSPPPPTLVHPASSAGLSLPAPRAAALSSLIWACHLSQKIPLPPGTSLIIYSLITQYLFQPGIIWFIQPFASLFFCPLE